ncbi:GLPGLI family protein [Chryseobacterium sp. GMJ5]|uniref:GLPGLI family protein n=1 Tax=Chryseobacterium gilvum TaxID=2976534 RepID=A0ABT2VZA9_9FLAO|nr:GLPGLI family protein [Chryseobacterium gilvum]MCU7614969.1 GLPGLI family protein [Chryseobacterium gilvum]
MKNILIIIITLMYCGLSAQNYRATYNFEYKRDSLSKDKIRKNMTLDIFENYTKFYFEKLLSLDSLKRKNLNVSFSSPLQQIVKRKRNTVQNQNFVSVDDIYYSFFTEDIIKWKVTDSIKIFDQYKVQKAVAYWSGRNWKAWFCSEIPLPEGPYKFTGLPGLIIKLEDDKNNFAYTLTSLKKISKTDETKNIVEKNLGITPIQITSQKYKKLLMNAYNNPFEEYKTMKQGTWVLDLFDKQINTIEGLKDITKEYQEDIRKNYNPIEIDQAVHYK